MDAPAALAPEEIRSLQTKHYNATITLARYLTPSLQIIRVRPDEPRRPFEAGQYTTLGLGAWEPCVAPLDLPPLDADGQRKLIRRAYSISAPLVDDAGCLLAARDVDYYEFYIALASPDEEERPRLTPRLFCLATGDRIAVGTKVTGRYTLTGVQPTDDVVFFATGTGEAPHNAMVAELLARGHTGRLVSVVCTRFRHDLAYAAAHAALERQFANYRYLTITTREPENLDPAAAGYIGKRYLQHFVADGEFERALGHPLDTQSTHVFLCGNPAMIGDPDETLTAEQISPQSGMIAVLKTRGFTLDLPRSPGNVHVEKYW